MLKPYYEDEAVTLYHGDCRDVLASLPRCDVLLTDPPYAISVAGDSHVNRPGKGTRNLDFFKGDDDWHGMTQTVVQALTLAIDSLMPGPTAYVFCGHRQFGSIVDLFEAAGFSTRPIIWNKACPVPAPPGSGWPSGAELCVYAYKAGRHWAYRPGEGPRSNVLTFDAYRHGQPGKVDHPTQKPLGLIQTLVQTCTKPGDVILDCFAGSGTTLRAAKDLGRRAIGIELEERYCEVIVSRLSQEVLNLEAA